MLVGGGPVGGWTRRQTGAGETQTNKRAARQTDRQADRHERDQSDTPGPLVGLPGIGLAGGWPAVRYSAAIVVCPKRALIERSQPRTGSQN